MRYSLILTACLLLVFSHQLRAQSDSTGSKIQVFTGFIRAGSYGDLKKGTEPFFSSVYSDFGLKVEAGNGTVLKGYADIRFRYGTEFREELTKMEVREAYLRVSGKKWDIDAGEMIIKWGCADFTNPTSRLNPRNFVSRSMDAEDIDLGNLVSRVRLYPSSWLTIEAVLIPLYRSSVLLTKPLALPENVKLKEIDSLVSGPRALSYAFKIGLNMKGSAMSISWFDGYNPMPGIALTAFNADLSGLMPVFSTGLSARQYKIRNLGFDFETAIGGTTLRGEAAYTIPYKSYKTNEYVPMKELAWVIGFDQSAGNWRFTGEYSGKFIPGFTPCLAEPIFGREIDPAALSSLLMTPGFDLNEYVRREVSSFNRLFNFQVKKSYHTFSIRIEKELLYSKLNASAFAQYNATSSDFLLMPALSYKPYDGLTICAGTDLYSGRKGSLYRIIDDFMNCARLGLKIDF
jgi:hypothetical protein